MAQANWMLFVKPLILFGIYYAPFFALALPLVSFHYKKAFYCYVAATLTLPFAFWFGIGGNLHLAAGVPVLLFMTGFAIQQTKFAFAWIPYVLQAAIVVGIIFTSAYYGLAPPPAPVTPRVPVPMTPF